MSQPGNLWFLFAAFSAIWLLLALFLVRLARGHRALEKEIGQLRAAIGGSASGHGTAGSASRRQDSPL